ncbi:alpha/beta fold hydrolase [Solihabitans fulvus]|uniref:Alpha/beta fold hydrolase n=1 Tax=Solihabitans fulvus TaxID=1892852 RepID=A0A5B2XBJ7_9PSEU|nr:alpha/beta fold hydrolase [Solihabitans fulvus]KAA2260450.1 alpha/beta fold hydrolase [Solihabitans fulvus]
MRTQQTRVPVSGGGSLWAERAGEGTPVVLLHGAGMDSRLWDMVFPALAGRHTVVRYDACGLGRSTPPTEPFRDVADLRAVLDHFGLDRAALVGMSLGGETALDFTVAHPDRVAALALVGSSVSGHTWPEAPDLVAYGAANRERDAGRLAELELSIWAPMGVAATGGELIATMIADNARRRVAGEHGAVHPDQDAVTLLGQVTAPTLVVHGDQDHPEIAAIAARLVAGIPGARGEVVPDADHYLPLRGPERLTDLLLAHLP